MLDEHSREEKSGFKAELGSDNKAKRCKDEEIAAQGLGAGIAV